MHTQYRRSSTPPHHISPHPHPTLTPLSPHSHPISHLTHRVRYDRFRNLFEGLFGHRDDMRYLGLTEGIFGKVRTNVSYKYISSAQLTMPDSNPNSKPEAEARSASLDLASLTHLSTHPTASHPIDPRAYAICCMTSNSIISRGGRLPL